MTAIVSSQQRPIKVCLLIRQLNLGGAQRQLVALAKGLDPERYRVTVLTFYPGGVFAEELQSQPHIDVQCLNKRGRWDLLCFYWRVLSALRRMRPDVIYSYMGGSNILTAVCRPFLAPVRILWGVRGSGLELKRYPWPERLTARLEAALSNQPQAILCNSRVGLAAVAARGFPLGKLFFVPNGINGEIFQTSASAVAMRCHWGVNSTDVVLGMVGRADPMKDHATCFSAVRILRQQGYPVRLVLVGFGSGPDGRSLRRQAEDSGVAEWCVWEAACPDMPAVYSAMSLLVLSSAFGEGFPNVVAEAMACCTPCVATDVGDAALLIGTLGEVVPVRDPEALAKGIVHMLGRLRENPELHNEVRLSILERFSIGKMVAQTAELFCCDGAEKSGREQRCASST